MPRYLLAYHGGHVDDSLEGRKRVMEEFGKWFAELGPRYRVTGVDEARAEVGEPFAELLHDALAPFQAVIDVPAVVGQQVPGHGSS